MSLKHHRPIFIKAAELVARDGINYACWAIDDAAIGFRLAGHCEAAFDKIMTYHGRQDDHNGWFGEPTRKINQERRVLALLFAAEFCRTEKSIA